MNRALFHSFPIRWRIARFLRDRAARRSMAELRSRDPSARPISVAKVGRIAIAVCVVASAYYLGEAIERKRQQRMDGLYSPTPPAPRAQLDCTPEGREVCKAQARMGKVKQL